MSRYKIHESILSEIDNLPTNDWIETEEGRDRSLSDRTKDGGDCNESGEKSEKCSGYECWM